MQIHCVLLGQEGIKRLKQEKMEPQPKGSKCTGDSNRKESRMRSKGENEHNERPWTLRKSERQANMCDKYPQVGGPVSWVNTQLTCKLMKSNLCAVSTVKIDGERGDHLPCVECG